VAHANGHIARLEEGRAQIAALTALPYQVSRSCPFASPRSGGTVTRAGFGIPHPKHGRFTTRER
jgi:hypothetical protein